jgi:hypothetical protein
MTAHRNGDPRIQAFLEDGPELLPDATFDLVRRDIHRTRQRVVVGPWTQPRSSDLWRYAAIAAVVVVAVAAGAFLLRSNPSGIFGRPSPSPLRTPVPNEVGAGPVDLVDGLVTLTVTVPEGAVGWSHEPGDVGQWKHYGPDGQESGPAVVVWAMTGTYVDPCTDHTLKQPPPTSIQGLISDLGNQPGVSAGPVTEITISGYKGYYVDTTITADISRCGNGDGDQFWLWASGLDRRYAQATGEQNRMYAMDVDGRPFTFNVLLPPTTTAVDRADVEKMLLTLRINRRTPAPSASDGSIPGRVRLVNGLQALKIDVPEGWKFDPDQPSILTKDYGPLAGPGFALWTISGTVIDPCTNHRLVEPAPTTREQLIAALVDQPGVRADGGVANVAVDGYSGQAVDLTVTADIAPCGPDGFWIWTSPNGEHRFVQDTGELNRVYVMDVDGRTYTFFARIPARTTDADRDELAAMLESIDIEAPEPLPSASPSP